MAVFFSRRFHLGLVSFVATTVSVSAVTISSPVWAASARAALHGDFSRLVFDFGLTPKFTASIENEQLVVRFEVPFEGAITPSVMRGVQGYLANPQVSADHRTISFTLLKDVQLKILTTESAAVIDLFEQKGKPAPSGNLEKPRETGTTSSAPTTITPPPEKTASASVNIPIPRIKTKVGDNNAFTRFVFDWPAGTNYRVTADDGIARIVFDKPGQFDLSEIRRRLPKSIAAVDATTNGSATEFAVLLPPKARVTDRKLGASILLDVQASTKGPAGTGALILSLTGEGGQEARPEPPPPPERAASPAPPLPSSSPPLATPPKPPVEPTIAPPGMTPVRPVTLTAVQNADKSLTLRIPTLAPLAAYVRGDQLYLAFSAPLAVDLTAVSRLSRIESIQLQAAHGSLVRLGIPAGLIPSLSQDEKGLVVFLRSKGSARPASPINVISDAENGVITLGVTQAAYPISAMDPDTGAIWRFIALPQTTRGIDAPREFAQLGLPTTLVGALVVSKSDAVEIRVAPSAVSIGAALTLSKLPNQPGSVKAYEFAKWKIPANDFLETRRRLMTSVMETDELRRPSARFDLAQFFVAQEQYSDALGVLEHLVRMTPSLATDPSLLALRGAVRVMREEGEQALADLSDKRLDSDREALLWRAAASAEIESWQAADALFRQAGGIPETYPLAMRAKLALLAAESAEKTGDARRAIAYTDLLAQPEVPLMVRAEGEFIRAKVLLKTNQRSTALSILDRLLASGDRRIRAHVEPVWAEEALKDGRIDRLEAIDRLEKSRYAWPGGSHEYLLLKHLTDLYLQNHQMSEALRTLREASNHFPLWAEADKLKEKMTDIFVDLYNSDTMAKVPPLAVLPLYDEYRDLTPQGARGDAMIQNLADRLVQIDLLDRAADLLAYQIDQRLNGVDKARVGERLALVLLLDRRPQDAVTAIDRSDVPHMPADLQLQRRRLKARALMEAGQPERGLSVIEGDVSYEGELLRAQLFSRSQNWSEAAQTLIRLAGSPSDPDMTREREGLIVNLAIATALSGESAVVSRLRTDFQPLMAKTSSAAAFELLTGGSRPITTIDQTALAQRFTELDIFQRAMTDYRQKIQQGKLSAIN